MRRAAARPPTTPRGSDRCGPVNQPLTDAQQIGDAVEMRPVKLRGAGNVISDLDIRLGIERWQQIELLEHEADLALAHACTFRIGKLGKVITIDDDASGVGPSQSTQ